MNYTQLTDKETIKKLKAEISELKEKNNQLNHIIKVIPGHIYWYDANNMFQGCNLQQALDAGFKSPEEMIGKTNADMPWQNQAQLLNDVNKQVMRTKKPYIVEEPSQTTNGYRIFLTIKSPLFDLAGNVSGVLGVSLDITEQKNLEKKLMIAREKANQANVAKTQFIANISHDIRTPLSGIIGLSEILLSHEKNSIQKEYIQKIASSGYKLLDILNEVIEYCKIESGTLPIQNKPLNLKNILNDIADLMFPTLLPSQVQFKINYPQNVPDNFIGDQARIHRIFLNLLSNAKKFTPKGGIDISVNEIKRTKNKSILQLMIKDTGIGIPPDKINQIFERFIKIHSSYSHQYQGTGLGLSIVKQFIEDLGGKIEVKSQLNQGTTFLCTLPLTLSEENTEKINQTNMQKTNLQTKQPLNILLIEDDETCQLVEKIILTEFGNKVDVANSAQQALNMLENVYDLIITDIGLPDMDGFDLIKQIRNNTGQNQLTPIIALTAHSSLEQSNQLKKIQITGILQKPMDKNTIIEIINKIHDTKN